MVNANKRYNPRRARDFYLVNETYKNRAEVTLLEAVRRTGFERLLDVGCGDGHFLVNFHDEEIFGLDASKAMVARAKPKIRKRVILGDICKPSPEFMNAFRGHFDVVSSNYLMTELTGAQLESAFENIRRVLRKEGSLLFTITNPKTIQIELPSGPRSIFSEPYSYEKRDLPFKVLLPDMGGRYRDVGIRDYHRPLEDYPELLNNAGFSGVSQKRIFARLNVDGKNINIPYAVLFRARAK